MMRISQAPFAATPVRLATLLSLGLVACGGPLEENDPAASAEAESLESGPTP